jgi:hypothetical protein
MKETPISFQEWKVKKILSWDWSRGNMLTRRLLKKQPLDIVPMPIPNAWVLLMTREPNHGEVVKCRYGIPGDILWMKETWAYAPDGYVYKADWSDPHGEEVVDFKSGETTPLYWRSSRFMPKVASRIRLQIVNIYPERVQAIDEIDAQREGWDMSNLDLTQTYDPVTMTKAREWFIGIWDSINKKKGFGWDANPYVWVIEYKRI